MHGFGARDIDTWVSILEFGSLGLVSGFGSLHLGLWI